MHPSTISTAIATIQRAARLVPAADLRAQAIADGATVEADPPRRRPDGLLSLVTDVGEAYPDGTAFAAAIAAAVPSAVGAALRALARLDGEAHVDAAMALAGSDDRWLREAAGCALARSASDRALAALVTASRVLREGLERATHPDAGRQIRAALDDTGLTRFTPRPRPTADEWDALDNDAQRALRAQQPPGRPSDALERAKDLVRVLVARRDLDALLIFTAVFDGHPDDRLRIACAHALADLRDRRADAVLDRRWDDADHLIASITVRHALLRDVTTAWARFAPAIEAVRAGATGRDARVVALLLHATHGGISPRRLSPDPAVAEPRLVELAAELRRHPTIGETARHLLSELPKKLVRAAVDRHPRRPPAIVPVATPARRDFLARYRAGEHAVWDELVQQHAAAIDQHPDLRAEAAAVAAELMRRVRHDTDAVRAVLRAAGARLADEDAPASAAELAPLIERAGPLPLALDAMWRIAGSLRLVPHDDDRYDYGRCALERDGLALLALDPLELEGTGAAAYAVQDHDARVEDTSDEVAGPLIVELAPDYLHKQAISGGGPYAIELPAEAPAGRVDPLLRDQRYAPTLVGYLRHAFRWGGFPGLDVVRLPVERIGLNLRIPFEKVKGSWVAASDRLLAALRRDLIGF